MARSETLLEKWPSPSPTMSVLIFRERRRWEACFCWQGPRAHIFFKPSDTCANYELSRFPERGVFPRICISLLVHVRDAEEEKEHKTFPLVYGRSEVFACNFFTVAPRSRIFFHTLLAALNGQIRLSHLKRYRPQNCARWIP